MCELVLDCIVKGAILSLSEKPTTHTKMNTIAPPFGINQIFKPSNHNRRRYLRLGVSRKPNGEMFLWSDWVREFDVQKESQISSPSAGWTIITTAVFDAGVENELLPTGWEFNKDEATWPQLFNGTALAVEQGLMKIEAEEV